MAGGIALAFGLRGPELRRVTHTATAAEAGSALPLYDLPAVGASGALGTTEGDAGAVDDGVTRGTERLAVGNIEGEVGMRFPRLNVMSVQMLSRPALLASVAVACKNRTTPLLVTPRAPLHSGQSALIVAGGKVATLITAILSCLPLALRERFTASAAGEGRGVIEGGRALRRACDYTISRTRHERLATHAADLRAAGVADEVPGMTNSERLPAVAAQALKGVLRWGMVNRPPVNMLSADVTALGYFGRAARMLADLRSSAHTLIIPHFDRIERLADMGLEPVLL